MGLRAGVCEVRDTREDGKKGKGGRKREDGEQSRVGSELKVEVGEWAALTFSSAELLFTWNFGWWNAQLCWRDISINEMIRVQICIRTCSLKWEL
jgi:hypothetical protein